MATISVGHRHRCRWSPSVLAGSLAGVKTSITGTKPATYHTKVNGVSVDATTNINDIAKSMTAGQMSSAGYDLSSATSLNSLVGAIQSLPQA